MDKDYLNHAAADAFEQAEEAGIGVPLDPDLADALGAFPEDALILADLAEDVLLTVDEDGEAVYVGEN